MIKSNTIKLSTIKLSTLTIFFAFSTVAIAANESNCVTTNDWQSSLAAEFSKLDASGNGLLMPLEASRGKAFNKKTFATADADNDGTLDQAEYVNHRTSMGATNQPSTANMSTANMSTANTSIASDRGSANVVAETPNTTSNLDSGMVDRTAEVTQDNTEAKKRTVGVVIDDSVITTKAKAAIFNTPDLKTLQISVETRRGEVTLTGMVDSDAAKMKAEEVVKNVDGVTAVTNNLQVKN